MSLEYGQRKLSISHKDGGIYTHGDQMETHLTVTKKQKTTKKQKSLFHFKCAVKKKKVDSDGLIV